MKCYLFGFMSFPSQILSTGVEPVCTQTVAISLFPVYRSSHLLKRELNSCRTGTPAAFPLSYERMIGAVTPRLMGGGLQFRLQPFTPLIYPQQ